MNILILGGTAFIGPHHVRYAIERGHHVAIFNRGSRALDFPDAVEQLTGDRNGDLASIIGRDWDAVIDMPTTLPSWVRTLGTAIAERTRHYIFISSLAVYADTKAESLDTSSPLRDYTGAADPFSLTTFGLDLYGSLKALSEREAERQFPGRTTIVRPSTIVGPGDETDRWTYWPARMKRGGEILAPGDPLDPAQYIDVRDLAEWVIRLAEQRQIGVYNATGPAMRMSFCEMLGGIRAISSEPVKLTWVPSAWLKQHDVTGADLPLWYPPPFDVAMRAEVQGSVAAGLTFRPLAVTAGETMEWHESRPFDRQQHPRAGWNVDREQQMLTAWHAS